MRITCNAPTELLIRADGVELPATLVVPSSAIGLCLFAHGSGSSRHSPRNRRVAEQLNARGIATLLFDLMTVPEAEADLEGGCLRFDVHFLAERLVAVTDRVHHLSGLFGLPLAYFGASTGAAAALIAATRRPELIAAVVSRGGRPDLAGTCLRRVRAPVLLIVGGADPDVITLNRIAARSLSALHRLAVVPSAGHLFEERGALDEVARLAADWLTASFADAARATADHPRPGDHP